MTGNGQTKSASQCQVLADSTPYVRTAFGPEADTRLATTYPRNDSSLAVDQQASPAAELLSSSWLPKRVAGGGAVAANDRQNAIASLAASGDDRSRPIALRMLGTGLVLRPT